MIEFECKSMPTLVVVEHGRQYRFRAGLLSVEPSEAVDVRAYAAKMPHLKITELTPEAEPVAPADSEPASMRMSKAELVALAAATLGTDEALANAMSKAELVGAINA